MIFFAQKQKNVCGRFAANQTVRPLYDNAGREQSTLLQRAASVLLATTLSASSLQAQQQCTVVPTQQTATPPQEKAAMNTEKTSGYVE